MVSWKDKAEEKRKAQAASIPLGWRLKSIPQDFKDSRPVIESSGILSPSELKITNTIDAAIICGNIQLKVWTSEAVATAFCKRAAAAQQLIGCCTELFFDKAITDAKALDEYLDKHGHTIGPLHGLPISLKDSYEIKGQDTTLGWVGLIGQPASGDSLSVRQLKELGAIIYCKTNVPQSLMMSDSYNHVFGQSVNALNRQLISGGSSGGEGAIVGAHGSKSFSLNTRRGGQPPSGIIAWPTQALTKCYRPSWIWYRHRRLDPNTSGSPRAVWPQPNHWPYTESFV